MTPYSQSLLGQNDAGAGEGLQYSLEPSWPMAAWVVLLFFLLASIAVLIIYLNERGGAHALWKLALAAVRLSLIAIVFVMLLGWLLHRERTDLPDVVILLDDSESMLLEDHYDDETLRSELNERVQRLGLEKTTRLNLAKALLLDDDAELLNELQSKYNLKFYRVGESARAETAGGDELADAVRSITGDQQESRLGKCVRDILEAQRGRPTAAMIVVTDGVTTEGKTIGEVSQYARRKAVPLFLVGVGNDRSPRDLRLSDLLVDEIVFVGDLVNFDVKLLASGYEGEQIPVRLRQEDDSQILAEQQVTVGKDGDSQTVRLSFRPEKKGDFEYVVEVEPQADEADTDNNRVTRLVSVRDETIRVLLVQSGPSFELRFLKTMLERQRKSNEPGAEKSIELTTVLQEADNEVVAADESIRRVFPVRRDQLFEYDVVIFGDVNPAGLGRVEMNNLADFVKVRGGGLVFIAGPRFTPMAYRDSPLSELMPVELTTASLPDPNAMLKEQFTLQPTELGLTSPQMQLGDSLLESRRIWGELEGMYWFLVTPDVKPAARVLAVHPTRTGNDGRNLPLITMQFVGAGKVIFHNSDESHRWRFRKGDLHFARYWVQTIRYLSRSKLLGASRAAELTTDREQYRRGESVHLRVRFFDDRLAPAQDDGVTVLLEQDQGQRRHIQLNRTATDRGAFETTISNLGDGRYRAWVATPTLEGNAPSQQFAVVAPPGEHARLEMDSADLRLAAKISQGKFYTIEESDRLLRDLPRGREVTIASLPPISIWNWKPFDMWPLNYIPLLAVSFGALFIVLIVIEWLVRKRLGML